MLRRRVAFGVVFLVLSAVAAAAQTPVQAPQIASRFSSSVQVSFLPPDPEKSPTIDLQAPAQQTPAPQTPAPPQLPQHTGFAALWHGTVSDFIDFPQRRSTWALLAIGAAGAAAAHPADNAVNARLRGSPTATRIFKAGKYMGGWVQAGAGIGTYFVGRYLLPPEAGTAHTNKVAHLGFDLVRAQILTQTLTHGIKQAGRRKRPTGECCSFPSGHASATFATAAVLERHLRLRGAWPTVVIASYVAVSRLHDNRHYLSDVVFGAALGTATGWTVVGRHGRSSYAWVPVRTPGGVAIMFTKQSHAPAP